MELNDRANVINTHTHTHTPIRGMLLHCFKLLGGVLDLPTGTNGCERLAQCYPTLTATKGLLSGACECVSLRFLPKELGLQDQE